MRERDKNVRKSAVKAQKKPYVKPSLRRLGSVRELTQSHPSTGAK